MPPLAEFEGGKTRFPMVFSFNAIGFGNSQLTTVALRNPYKRASAAQLRLMLGIGSLSDSREGALKVISETTWSRFARPSVTTRMARRCP